MAYPLSASELGQGSDAVLFTAEFNENLSGTPEERDGEGQQEGACQDCFSFVEVIPIMTSSSSTKFF